MASEKLQEKETAQIQHDVHGNSQFSAENSDKQ
jgi:hypothetical protein